jgi:hypothetical protein
VVLNGITDGNRKYWKSEGRGAQDREKVRACSKGAHVMYHVMRGVQSSDSHVIACECTCCVFAVEREPVAKVH